MNKHVLSIKMNFSTCLMCGVSALSAALVTSIIVLHQQQSRVVVVVEAKPAQAQAQA